MSGHRDDAEFVRATVAKHHGWFSQSLPMIASENLISPLAREMLLSDFGDRYAEGHPGARYYQGCSYIDEVERRCEDLAKALFRCPYADVRPTSGTVANLGVLFGLAKPGETLTTIGVNNGAHISSEKFGAVGMRNLNRVEIPFDVKTMSIDVDAAAKVIREAKPRVALFGQSVFLFPAPIRELRPALEEVGSIVLYDAAHVLGLVAGGQFQDPLREGADVITGSTHKTFPGPQHGIVLAEPKSRGMEAERMKRKLDGGIFPGVVSNHHLHSVAALAVSLAEFLEFGRDYARQVVANAKALGQALHERGFKVLCPERGFTASHTLAVDVKAQGGGKRVVEDLERAGIIANKNLLPWDDVGAAMNPTGIRLGAQELTRLGMKERDMATVAELIKKVAVDNMKPGDVAIGVAALRKEFNTIHYCFSPGVEAHKVWRIVA